MIDRRTFSKVMAAGAASGSAIGTSAASATAAQATAREGTPQRHGAPGGPGLGPSVPYAHSSSTSPTTRQDRPTASP